LLVPVTPKPEKLASVIEEYNFAVDKGYKGSFTDYRKEMARAGATNVTTTLGPTEQGVDKYGNPVFFQPRKEGGEPSIIPGVRPAEKPLNEGQANAAGFAKRLEMANEVINASPFEPTIGNQLKAAIPFSNAFLSDAQQQSEQAQREFITAQLRRESGASISPGEFDTARKQYFPQPGDSKATLEQKAQSRALAIKNMRGAAGPSSKPAAPAWLPGVQSALDKYAPQGGR
jgi:methionyl-tRNA formyltransferase